MICVLRYDISMLGSTPGEPHHKAAKKILDDNNVNEVSQTAPGSSGAVPNPSNDR